MIPWKYQEKLPDLKNYTGFVYKITCRVNQKYYIGQKKFWFKRKLKPLKGRKNARHYVVESDWKTYYGSSMELLADLKKYGEANFDRTILVICKRKAMMNYYEAKRQFEYDVLYDSLSYNGIINCRISKNQLPKTKEKV